MQITDAQLRTIIRNMLLEQDTGQTAASPAADQAHKQVEQTFKLDDGFMTKGDASYNDVATRYPSLKEDIDKLFVLFDAAKEKRISYLQNQFTARYSVLRKTLGKTVQVDAEALRDSMIARLRKSKLMLSKYPEQLESNSQSGTTKAYDPSKDPKGVWTKLFGASASLVYAFAPHANADVFANPPLVFMFEQGAEYYRGFIPASTQQTYEHELIHQEDNAAREMMQQSATGEDATDTLARDLIRTALIPTKDLNINTINERFAASKKLSELVRTELSNFAQNLEADPKYEGMAAVSYLSRWFSRINSSLSPIDQTTLYAQQIAAGDKDLEFNLQRFQYAYTRAARSRIDDLTIPSHLRITLTEMRPHLEAALAKHGEQAYGPVVEDTLTAMDASDVDAAHRASIILAVTDPAKLRSLTQVAMGSSPPKGTKTPAETPQTALAERWTRLAGIQRL
jgi:hypothetical protein